MLVVAPAGVGRADTRKDILDRGKITVGVRTGNGPWEHYLSDGTIAGLKPDLDRLIVDELGGDLRLVAVTSANRLSRLEQGGVDLVIATMGGTKER